MKLSDFDQRSGRQNEVIRVNLMSDKMEKFCSTFCQTKLSDFDQRSGRRNEVILVNVMEDEMK